MPRSYLNQVDDDSSAFGGLIAFGLGHAKGPTPQWKWLFLVEALPGFVLGLFALYWLPDRPLKNNRFKGEMQDIAAARFHSEAVDRAGSIQRKHVIWAVSVPVLDSLRRN